MIEEEEGRRRRNKKWKDRCEEREQRG